MSQPETPARAVRYGSRYAAPGAPPAARTCPMCNTALLKSRATFCSVACKQRAFRLRHQQPAMPELTIVREQLKRQWLLAAHTIYECPSCEERFVGERRCPSCHLFCRALGVGGQCPECDQPILLSDLLGLELTADQ
jgi:ssDNA-binding Zn-finger/Zn-ribbon topoisomerase 1